LRLVDCALLEWGAIDLARNRIMTIPRKTKRHAHGKPVVIPLHPTLAALLAEIPPKGRKGYLLPTIAATYLDDDTKLSRRIQAIFTNAGIRTQTTAAGERAKVDIGFHSLRHTFVSLSANAGAPLAVVQAIVGHSNPAMTRHYFHESEAALQSAVAALPSISLDGAQAAENAPAALPSPVAATAPADGTDAPTSPVEREDGTNGATAPTDAAARLEAFKAAFSALTNEERKTACKWIVEQQKERD